MQELVGTFFCEWTEAIKSPDRRKLFQQFGNTDETIEDMDNVKERNQERPTYWVKDSATQDFRGTKWSELTWQPIIKAEQFTDSPTGMSANVKRGDTQLAIFKIKGKWYATQQMCPHKRAFVLSDGLLGDDAEKDKLWVSCPHHKRNFELKGPTAGTCTNDASLNIATFSAEERDDGWVYLKLPPIEELDGVLGTQKWKVRKEEAVDPFVALDKKLKGMRGRKVEQKIGGGIRVGGLDAGTRAPITTGSGGCGSGGIDW